MVQNICDRHILKDNSWMCILHQYHKVSGLKASTMMCRKQDENPLAVVKEYEIIMLKYNGKACRLDLLYFCAPEDIIL